VARVERGGRTLELGPLLGAFLPLGIQDLFQSMLHFLRLNEHTVRAKDYDLCVSNLIYAESKEV
jgi:hypothetical protein